MNVISDIFAILGLILITLGVVVFLFQIVGVIKYKYLLNRMHAAGMGDTLGLMLCLLGLICLSGLNLTSLKLVLVLVFMWFSSPTSSHLISRMEAASNDSLGQYADIKVDKEDIK